MDEILSNWDIGDVYALEPIPSFWGKTQLVNTMDGHEFILKEKADLQKTERETNLLSNLEKAGAPVAVPIATMNGKCCASVVERLFCLYPKLPGEVITEHYGDDAIARANAFGRAIAFLHTCFQKCDHLGGFTDIQLLSQIQEWAIPRVQKHQNVVDSDAVEKIWRDVEQEITPLYPELPSQLIHRDLNPANMLFDRGQLTGFVDFDMVVRGPRIFDLCYCGSSILVGGFQDAAKVKRWPEIFHSLVMGYQDVCSLVSSEYSALYGVLVTIQLLFMAFSLETQAEGAAKCNANVLQWLSENRDLILV